VRDLLAHDRRQISVVANARVEGGKRVDRHCDDFFVARLLLGTLLQLEHGFEFFFKGSRRNSECAKSRPVL
jgi:hypothetical protein